MRRPLLLAIALVTLVPAVAAADSDAQWFGRRDWGRFPGRFWRTRPPPRLGLQITPMTPELRKHFGAPEDRGVLVGRVFADSPAAKAGVKVGDVVIEANGKAVRGLRDLLRGKWRQGGEVKLTVIRGRQRTDLVARIPKGKDRFRYFFRGKPHGLLPSRPDGKFKWFAPDGLRKEMDKLRKRLRKLEKRFGDQKTRKPI